MDSEMGPGSRRLALLTSQRLRLLVERCVTGPGPSNVASRAPGRFRAGPGIGSASDAGMRNAGSDNTLGPGGPTGRGRDELWLPRRPEQWLGCTTARREAAHNLHGFGQRFVDS